MNRWILFIHVLGAFIFALTHGASTKVILRIKVEQSREKLAALLDLSARSTSLLYASLLVLLLAGIANGFLGHWWGQAWIWVGLALLLGLFFAMYALATVPLTRLRKALGLPYSGAASPHPAEALASPPELEQRLAAIRPGLIAGIGYTGLTVIVWLMVLKPF